MKYILTLFTITPLIAFGQTRKILIDTPSKHWLILRDEQMLVMKQDLNDSISKIANEGWRVPTAEEMLQCYNVTFDKKSHNSPILMGAGGFTSTIKPKDMRVSLFLYGDEPSAYYTVWEELGHQKGNRATLVKDFIGDMITESPKGKQKHKK